MNNGYDGEKKASKTSIVNACNFESCLYANHLMPGFHVLNKTFFAIMFTMEHVKNQQYHNNQNPKI